MSVEGVPTKTESKKEEIVSGYDSEAVLEEAEQQLQELLDGVDVPENVPNDMVETYRLSKVLLDLDTPDFDNADRFIARVAEEEFKTVSRSMPQKSYEVYKNYMPKHEDVLLTETAESAEKIAA